MYAIIKTGGKQYKVAQGDVLSVEKLAGYPGDEIAFDQVLLIKDGESVALGRPTVSGASVTAKILKQDRARKILVFHKKRRKGYRKKAGHRQPYTELTITGIER